MRRPAIVLAAGTIGVLAASALVVAVPAQGVTSHGRGSIHFTVDKHFRARGPARTRSGIAHLRVTKGNAVAVLEAKHGTGSRQQLSNEWHGGSSRALFRHYTLFGVVTPGAGLYARLRRGTLYALNAAVNNPDADAISATTVVGPTDNAHLPAAHTMIVSPSRILHAPARLPRAGWIKLDNRSSEYGLLSLSGISPKFTDRQLRALVTHPTRSRYYQVEGSGNFEPSPEMIFNGPHATSWQFVSARHPGHYLVVLGKFYGRVPNKPDLYPGVLRIFTVR